MISKHYKPLLFLLLFSSIHLSGCAEDLVADPGNTNNQDTFVNEQNEDGTITTYVDATIVDVWVYFDFESTNEVFPETPENDSSWDLAFTREKIKSNGGVSGSGLVEIARMPSVDFDGITEAPGQGYQVDQDDSDDGDTDPDYVFLGESPWYDYNFEEHTLAPADVVYIVRSVEGNYFKVQIEGYYDEAGTSGYPSFRWAEITPPSGESNIGPDEVLIEASPDNDWQYVNVTSRSVVNVSDPMESNDWDMAVKGTQIKTNSGTSGSGLAGVIESLDEDWDTTQTCPTVGYAMDALVPIPGPPGSGDFSGNPVLNEWYNYDMDTHTVSPKDTTYLVRTATGKYVKMQIVHYGGDTIIIRTGPVDKTPTKHSTEIVTPDDDSFIYLNFDSGTLVEPDNPVENSEWDLAVSGVWMQTNSGTSGSGEGGSIDLDASTLDEITSVPVGSGCYLGAPTHTCDCDLTESACTDLPGAWTPQCACPTAFVIDEMLPLPGPPGSGEDSGNSILTSWYNYDPTSHEISPKEAAYVLRTALGHFVKLQVTDYADNTMTIEWFYAGPAQNKF